MDIAVFFSVFLREHPAVRHCSLYLVYRLLPALRSHHSKWLWDLRSSGRGYEEYCLQGCDAFCFAYISHLIRASCPIQYLRPHRKMHPRSCPPLTIRNVMLLRKVAEGPSIVGCPRLCIQDIWICSIYADHLRLPCSGDALCHGGKGPP